MDQYGSVQVDQWTSPTDPANPRGDAVPEETRQSEPANPRGDAVRQLVGGGYKHG